MRYLILHSTNNGDSRAHMCELPDDTDIEAIAASTFGLQVGTAGDDVNPEGEWYIVEMPEGADQFRPLVLDNYGQEVPMTLGSFQP